MYRDGFLCPLCGQLMGETAENLAREYGILRAEQDAYARRVAAARRRGDRGGPLRRRDRAGDGRRARRAPSRSPTDEHPRPDTTLESLAKLPPVFDAKDGTVHAGNSSGITDGAAALVLGDRGGGRASPASSRSRASSAWTSAGVDPARMGIGPVPAIRALLEKTGRTLADIDLIELNEAFAAQVIACARELSLDLGAGQRQRRRDRPRPPDRRDRRAHRRRRCSTR